jgi:hypothetical protein
MKNLKQKLKKRQPPKDEKERAYKPAKTPE